MRRLITTLVVVVLVAALLLLIGAGLLYRTVPAANERRDVAGLERAATIVVDEAGVPTLRGESLADLSFLSGWAHARDRRFQMELQRRSAAGRLAEVVGPALLAADRRMRTFGFAVVAESAAARLGVERRRTFESYAAGVNAYDRSHPAPPEFALLRIPREPWRVEDCLLTVLVMFEQLQDDGSNERMVEVMDVTLPAPLVEFLLPDSTPGDVALAGGRAPAPPAMPGRTAEALVAGTRPANGLAAIARDDRRARGSNNWAVAPSRTATGGALLAGDPHLGLRVPVIWHRQRLEGAGLAITGITLPGVPGVVAGSNGHVAWSLTNVEGDFADLVRFDFTPGDSSSYVGPAGPEPFRVRTEVLRARGAQPETLRVRETRWGPDVGASIRGGRLALQWVALAPEMLDFDLWALDRAASVAELLDAVATFRGPAQNFVAADDQGHIGWRIGGGFPRRAGFDPLRPRDGTAAAGWNGFVYADSLPRVMDPADGVIVTANHRTLGAAWQPLVGRDFAMPWRAARIRQALLERRDWDAAGMNQVQNDVRDSFLDLTAAALDAALTREACAANDTLARVRGLLDGWTRRADTTSVAHGYLRYARLELNAAVQAPLIAPCVAADSNFSYDWPRADEVTRRLLEARPAHLLDPAFEGWDALVRSAAIRGARAYGRAIRGEVHAFDSLAWGSVNRAAIHHPLGDAVPALGRWLNQPHAALAGGSNVVRVARPRTGASMRLVADLADPARSTFTTPGGQSGHFLSKHYGDAFGDWVAGRTRPLEPGRAAGTITLTPARPAR